MTLINLGDADVRILDTDAEAAAAAAKTVAGSTSRFDNPMPISESKKR